jgi:predicted DNA-binding transcriptional regulator YafY
MVRETILRALEERRVLQITYGTDAIRFIQPHAILRKPDGTELVEAYQVRGHSDGGADHGWRHFSMGRISHAELLEEHFEPRRDFKPVSGRSGELVVTVRPDETIQT